MLFVNMAWERRLHACSYGRKLLLWHRHAAWYESNGVD